MDKNDQPEPTAQNDQLESPAPEAQPQPEQQPPVAPGPDAPQTAAGPQPQPMQPAAPGPVENPGQTLGIIGLVLNFLGITIGGIILGVMSRNKSKEANMSTTLGTISLVWGIVATALAVLAILFFVIIMIAAASSSTATETGASPDYSSSSYSSDN